MKLKLFILILALQCAWIGYTVATQEHALTHGAVILLETQRVDPRDMLRGDYLILNYKISDVPEDLFLPPVKTDLHYGAKIFVALAPNGTNEFYNVVRASTNEMAPRAGEVVVRGAKAYSWRNGTNSVHVEYGLEKFYVAEGTGNPTGKLTVQAVVTKSGRPSIKDVFVNGKPYAEAIRR